MPITLQILHTADQEAGLSAIQDAVNFSAVIEGLADDFENTIRLSSGDIYIPGAFFNASDGIYDQAGIGDILINNALGFQAVALGNHEFDAGTGTLANLIGANPEITGVGISEGGYQGTNFPYLSTNLDFSSDANLADLVVADGGAPQPNSITGSTVIEVGGELIGVIGATTPTLEDITSSGDVTVLPANDDINALAAEIQSAVDSLSSQGINKIILLAHMQQLGIEQQLAELLDGVDVVIGGGSNTILANDDDILREGDVRGGEYPLAVDSNGETVYVINTDGNYRYVGQLVVDFDDDGIITAINEASGAYATDDAGVDRVYGEDVNPADVANPTVVEVTQAISDAVSERDGNIFGSTEVFLNGTRGDVRTQETNLGNLSADANLFIAQQYDPTVTVSIKNGGGIRDNIGEAIVPAGSVSGELELSPPAANPLVGKEEGDISQLDIENSLRFNNGLTLLTVTAAQLLEIIEHGVEESGDDATPGRFPQVGGLNFTFDVTQAAGERIGDLEIVDGEGNVIDTIASNGELVGDGTREIRLVTLNFLADGGDGYPFPDTNRVDLVDQPLPDGGVDVANFTDDGSEQDALAEYLSANFSDTPFSDADTAPELDTRIQTIEENNTVTFDTTEQAQVQGLNGYTVDPLVTIGETIEGYTPPGIPDGMGAFAVDNTTLRLLVNHELTADVGYAYTLANGTELTGARVSFFDIDTDTREVLDAGLAYDTIINRQGEIVDEASDLEFGGIQRLCSAQYIEAGQFGDGIGLEDAMFFTGEETGGGTEFVIDAATNTMYAVPWMGRAAWESVTELDTGDTEKVAILIGDDRGGAPMLMYVGTKDRSEDAGFLARNGLEGGKIYAWAADSGETSPEEFNGTFETRTGSWVEIDFYRPDLAGTAVDSDGDDSIQDELGYDADGFATQAQQDQLAEDAGAFAFSRPEDVATNPEDGTEAVFTSTGRSSLFPSDSWGTTYTVNVDFNDIDAGDITATLDIIYDGDDGGAGQFTDPDFGLRSPDNLDWADDGFIYLQEDRSISEFGDVSGEETSIWRLDPDSGELLRVAQVDRSAVPDGSGSVPSAQIDTDPTDLGDWETSGIIDVSNFFGEDPGELFLFNVQAHSLAGGEIDSLDLVQGGQIAFLENNSSVDGLSEVIRGTEGDDELFANDGEDTIIGRGGDDTFFLSSGDRILGGAGNDTFLGADGSDNWMSGGSGDDTFFLGSGDRAFGGTGADAFWIVNGDLPTEANRVGGFELGEDVLGVVGFTFNDLEFDFNTISINGIEVANIVGINTATLSEADFVFI